MKGVTRDILLSSLVGALICGLLAQVGIALAGHLFARHHMADLGRVVDAASLARCNEAPASWELRRGLLLVTAHHPDGRSEHPGAPMLDVATIPQPGEPARQLPDGPARTWDRSATQRVAEAGPCAVLHAWFPHPMLALPVMRGGGLAGVFLGSLLVLAVTITFATRPLLRRLRRLDAAARWVGAERFTPVADPGDDELGRVASAIDRSHARIVEDQQRLAERGRVLEQHLAAVAHDLRTPLASLQLTLERIDGQAPDTLRTDLGAARLEVGSLEALADNLLQASRLRGGLDVVHADARVDLVDVASRVAMRFELLGRSRGITVHAGLPDGAIQVRCDPSLAERTLSNLVHNAVVHGPADHPVGLFLDRLPEGFELTVHSAGAPLDDTTLAGLAERRLVEPGPDRSRGRHGLGLAIVNEVVARAGWQVRYRSPPEGGLRVAIRGGALPLRS